MVLSASAFEPLGDRRDSLDVFDASFSSEAYGFKVIAAINTDSNLIVKARGFDAHLVAVRSQSVCGGPGSPCWFAAF